MDLEEKSFKSQGNRREKCLTHLATTKDCRVVDLQKRIKEISDYEELVAEMWKRLKMDAIKGDPSYPLKQARNGKELDAEESVDFIQAWMAVAFKTTGC